MALKVFLNPGHAPNGDPDPGACGNGLRESDIVFDVANLVEKYLVAAGVPVVGNLQLDSLGGIAEAANESGADIFVSIHCNSANTSRAVGTETFRYNCSYSGGILAACIQNQIVNALSTVDRGLKDANFAVLRLTDMTAVLVELAFISNPSDAELLANNKDDFARAIARGITDYQSLLQ